MCYKCFQSNNKKSCSCNKSQGYCYPQNVCSSNNCQQYFPICQPQPFICPGQKGDKGDTGTPGTPGNNATSIPDLITFGASNLVLASATLLDAVEVQTGTFLIPFGRFDPGVPVVIVNTNLPVGVPVPLSLNMVVNLFGINLFLPPLGTNPRIAKNPVAEIILTAGLFVPLLPIMGVVGITFVLGRLTGGNNLLTQTFIPSNVRVTIPIPTNTAIAIGTILSAANATSDVFPAGSRLAVLAFLTTESGGTIPLGNDISITAGISAQFTFELA